MRLFIVNRLAICSLIKHLENDRMGMCDCDAREGSVRARLRVV